jgi:hypothetical protein
MSKNLLNETLEPILSASLHRTLAAVRRQRRHRQIGRGAAIGSAIAALGLCLWPQNEPTASTLTRQPSPAHRLITTPPHVAGIIATPEPSQLIFHQVSSQPSGYLVISSVPAASIPQADDTLLFASAGPRSLGLLRRPGYPTDIVVFEE